VSEKRKKRLLSGRRPTGPIHLGHVLGAIDSWVGLQDEYDCFFFSADWHALTTGYQDSLEIERLTLENWADILACGVDPQKSACFVQSDVKAHAELWLLFSMFTPVSWLERVPSYKSQQEELREKDLSTAGFLSYPLLQAADILIYLAEAVPVGEDQASHVELCREVARRFNHLYKSDLFPEPKTVHTPFKKVPGTDGRKMSASYGNAVNLDDPAKKTEKALKRMVTDPARVQRSDPGNPENCPVFDLHRCFSTDEQRAWASEGCTTAGIGCVDCKMVLIENIETRFGPIREKREELLAHPDDLKDILADGAKRASAVAEPVVERVREAMGLGRTAFGRG
jgi:tryptophanyl-tRNA synthetase